MATGFTDFDVSAVILRQYSNSPGIVNMANLLWQAVSPSEFIDDFYTNIWDVSTANTYGLDIWGKIVNLSRTMEYSDTNLYFGFREAQLEVTTTTDPQPFNTYPFYDPTMSATGRVVLSDDYYRKAIMMKAMMNITDCTVPKMNAMLMYMFSSSGNAWVQHDGPRAMSYRFDFTPNTTDLAIIQNGNILPRPAGCVVSYIFETT
jgi:hypothetical protein